MRGEGDDDLRGGPGWLATLFGAALLLAAGFAVGVVVGAVREEPAMLLRYVTGKGVAIPAPAASPAAPAPAGAPPPQAPAAPAPPPVGTAAAPPIPPAPARPRPAPAVAPPERPQPVIATAPPAGELPRASVSAPHGRFAVQVGAFAQSSEAEKLEAQLKRKGLPAYVQPATGARDSRWRVRIGPLASRDEADRVATRLKTQDKLPVWVLEDNG